MRILLAIDGSPGSDAAVEEVWRRPWPSESEIRVVTVLSPLESFKFREGLQHPQAYDDVFEQQGWEAAKRLKDVETLLEKRARHLRVTPVLLEGQPKEAILDEAERWGADLIIVGSRGTGTIKRFLLGSVSLAVVLNATCSVEIVRRSIDVPEERMMVDF